MRARAFGRSQAREVAEKVVRLTAAPLANALQIKKIGAGSFGAAILCEVRATGEKVRALALLREQRRDNVRGGVFGCAVLLHC